MQSLKIKHFLILSCTIIIFSITLAYTYLKKNRLLLNAEATMTISALLKAQDNYYNKHNAFIATEKTSASEKLNLRINENIFFKSFKCFTNGNNVEIVLKCEDGFFKGTSVFATYTYREKTTFEIQEITKIPLPHL